MSRGILYFIILQSFVSYARADNCVDIFRNTYQIKVRSDGYSPSKVPLKNKSDLRIATWNLQDFYVRSVRQGDFRIKQKRSDVGGGVSPKPESKVRAIHDTIKDIAPDILVLNEVVGEHSTLSLDPRGEYHHIVDTPTDSRGLRTTFMVRQSLFVEAELYLPQAENRRVHLKRGLPTILLRQKNEFGKVDKSEAPLLIVMGVHLLSQSRTSGQKLVNAKKGEALLIIDAIKELEAAYPNVPIVIKGDFNIHLPAQFSVNELQRSFLASLHNKLPEPKHEEATFAEIKRGKRKGQSVFVGARTLDAIVTNDIAFEKFLGMYIYRFRGPNLQPKVYKDENGRASLIPLTREQKLENPSDHFPIISDYDLSEPL